MTQLGKTRKFLLCVALMASAGAVQAADVTGDRSYDSETGTYSTTREVVAENGASVTVDRTCTDGDRADGCLKSRTVTGLDGESVTREQLVVNGPRGQRTLRRFTDTAGETHVNRRRWRN
ncbi:hypothetical protein LCGC14_2412510 [marine sediment metagenome]|uniref:Uncharacterized protein n=1 Tax=marine sediment metagenome TaxID=412755 RepID=A0A0F9BS33_9ZZZZ